MTLRRNQIHINLRAHNQAKLNYEMLKVKIIFKIKDFVFTVKVSLFETKTP